MIRPVSDLAGFIKRQGRVREKLPDAMTSIPYRNSHVRVSRRHHARSVEGGKKVVIQ